MRSSLRCMAALLLAASTLPCPTAAAPARPGKPAAGQKARPVGRPSDPVGHRWVYVAANLLVPQNAEHVKDVMRRAKAAGYNGIVLSDYKLQVLDRLGPEYSLNAESVRAEARSLDLEFYAAVCPVGYSNGLLSHDPNLAEGLPVRNAPFRVRGREAGSEPDPATSLPGGDFESGQGDKLAGWTFQDAPGVSTFADRSVVHGGSQSLRMQDIGQANPPAGNARVMRTVTVSPFRQYRLSVWVRTQEFETPGNVRAVVLDAKGQSLAFPSWSVQSTQDWTEYQIAFNSLDNTQLNVYLGVWGGKGGKIWWDDARLEDAGLLNVLRRSGCPLVVKGEDGTVYEEGRDFEPVRDEKMGTIPWAGEYEVRHAPPSIHLARNSRIPNGARLFVSYHHVAVFYDGQVPCCLTEPKVYALLKDQVQRVNRLLHPTGFLMSHDEIRVANWCEACQARKMTPGQLLADNVARCIRMIRAEAPKAQIAVWSDMFDPYHNAVEKGYYLLNGSLLGSWKGLSPDVLILNWNFDNRTKSPAWFARRGHPQVIAGYYDASPDQIKTWLSDTKGVPRMSGVMYTTWADRYDDLEAFAREAWGKP